MRKIKIIEHISLDGVIQAPGGPNEDGDYSHGGWAVPHHDPAVGEAIVAGHGKALDLLLGRRTYDIFSAYWPKENSLSSGNVFADLGLPDAEKLKIKTSLVVEIRHA